MTVTRREIGDLLVDNGVITPEELDLVREEREKTGDPISTVLSRMGLAGEAQLKNALELEFGVNFVDLTKLTPDLNLISMLPAEVIKEHLVVPIAHDGHRLTVAMVDPSDTAAENIVKETLNWMQVKTVVCLEDDFTQFLPPAYRRARVTAERKISAAIIEAANAAAESNGSGQDEQPMPIAELEETSSLPTLEQSLLQGISDERKTEAPAVDASTNSSESTDDAETLTQPSLKTETSPEPEATSAPEVAKSGSTTTDEEVDTGQFPIVSEEDAQRHMERNARTPSEFSEVELARRAQEEAIVLLANQILGGAIKRHCSNIHITTGERQAIVQYRLNGQLYIDRRLPSTILTALIARYKMMARMNLSENKVPQDGHIKVKSASKEIVCLVSTVPTSQGENVVIWIV